MTGLRQAGMAAAVLCVLLLLAFSGGAHGSYCWDHQQKTYNATFKPGTCGGTCTVTPFFSPDTSLPAYVQLIDAAQTSIDIYTPSMKSWDEMCTKDTDCPDKGSCTGCPIEEMRNETFPIFPALLNAVHERGVKVRIITNNFTFAACESRIIPLDWFALNKIEIRMYNTTTFQHAKYIMIDKGKKTAVSSVNWSQTSFLMNREAGVILEDCTCSAISDFYIKVFNYDWDTGINYVISRTYTDSEMKIITDPAHMPYSILPNNSIPGVFVTQLIPHRGVEVKKVYASPDSARETLMDYLDSVQKSLHLSIYQVTDSELCSKLLELFNKGVNVTILVSHNVIPPYNRDKAWQCYKNLTSGGMKGSIQSSYTKFRFSHEKYWITDGTTLHLSTGNWSPGDFPMGDSWEPLKHSGHSVNRDLEIVLEHPDLVDYFINVYTADWYMGTPWESTN